MRKKDMTPELLALVAARFKALGEPARLQIANCLRDGEMTVSELIEATGFSQSNVSKHLQLLHMHGFVSRRRDGLFTYYELADESVVRLCDLMCGRLAKDVKRRQKMLAG